MSYVYAYNGHCVVCKVHTDKMLSTLSANGKHQLHCAKCFRILNPSCEGSTCPWCNLINLNNNYNPATGTSIHGDYDRAMKGV